jgi:GDP/UDP-N,N'-diacetylbacillosamine 2-epimerase (hydrolysing)
VTHRKKICAITGSRAEYGLLRGLLSLIHQHDSLQLQLAVTGAHLSSTYGNTVDEIDSDGYSDYHVIDLNLVDNTQAGVVRSIGTGLERFVSLFEQIRPDAVLVLGDRYEIFSSVVAAAFLGIPIIHIHGGELSLGSIDDSIRHAITKFSHLHFTAAGIYRKRVIQLGESPKRVFNCGGLGVDAISQVRLLSRAELENKLNIHFSERNFLVTFHPVTINPDSGSNRVEEIFSALKTFSEATIIFTLPNADAGSAQIRKKIIDYGKANKNVYIFTSLGQINYLSCLSIVDIIIGNSSSGLIEAPVFGIPTVNIGNRQNGRLKSDSVLDCKLESRSIVSSIRRALDPSFRTIARDAANPYGEAGASQKIFEVIKNTDFSSLNEKHFYDYPWPA